MLNLLRIEWMKFKNYRTFWILVGIIVLAIPGVNYAVYSIVSAVNSKDKSPGAPILNLFGFPDGWHTVCYVSSMLFIMQAILIITLTTNEFTFKTHRQNIIDGWSRSAFISVKFAEVFLLSVLSTLTVLLTVLAFGYLAGTGEAHVSVWQGSRFLFFYFVQVISYSMIAFVIAVLIKRSGLAIGLFLIYMIVEQVVMGIITNLLKLPAGQYLPEESTDRLIPFPGLHLMSQLEWEHRIPGYLTAAAIYLIIYCVVTGRYFLKSDL
ncbi:MAG TPA: ABC transporter permease [Puia sp.]|jgi:ABC-type transport system involved in multi-copper enzyme maturation permease subunit|nr:ABC transporter permease [Puia sp.]